MRISRLLLFISLKIFLPEIDEKHLLHKKFKAVYAASL